jgi:hypothetical protein
MTLRRLVMNLLKKILILTAAMIMVFSVGIKAASTDYAGEAMSIGVGARALGMGGAFAAVADDASTSYWNPAGMTQITGVEVSSIKLTHINDLDTKYSYVNLVYNGNQSGAFGIGWLRQAIDDIKITGITTSGNPTNSIIQSNADNSIYLAYAYPVVQGFSLGATVKLLLGNYPAFIYNTSDPNTISSATVSYFGYGFDMGLLFNMNAFVKDFNLSIGLNVQDIYTTIGWAAVSNVTTGFTEQVGFNLKPGIAYKLPIQQFEFIVASDVDTRYDQLVVHAGGELWWNKMVAIRGGYKMWGQIPGQTAATTIQQKPDWSMGASLRWYFIGVDYAYVYNELTPVQYLSIIGKF